MEVWSLIFAAIGALGALIAIPAAIYAVTVSRRQVAQNTAVDLGREIIQLPEFREKVVTIFREAVREVLDQAKEDARTVAIDQIHLLINNESFVAQPVYNSDVGEIKRRLSSLEEQVLDVPRKTAEQVLILIRRKDAGLT